METVSTPSIVLNDVLLTVHTLTLSTPRSSPDWATCHDVLDPPRKVWTERLLYRQASHHGRTILDYCHALLADIRTVRGVRLPSILFFFKAQRITLR